MLCRWGKVHGVYKIALEAFPPPEASYKYLMIVIAKSDVVAERVLGLDASRLLIIALEASAPSMAVHYSVRIIFALRHDIGSMNKWPRGAGIPHVHAKTLRV